MEFVEVRTIAWLPPGAFMRVAVQLPKAYDRLKGN